MSNAHCRECGRQYSGEKRLCPHCVEEIAQEKAQKSKEPKHKLSGNGKSVIMRRIKRCQYIITIKVTSKHGTRPSVRSIGGDTIFCYMADDGQSAVATVKKVKTK